jgi:tetratricopeptide (TPR) repeat protein
MYVQPIRESWTVARWFEVLAIAVLATLLLATTLAAADRNTPPPTLPSAVLERSVPMSQGTEVEVSGDLQSAICHALALQSEKKFSPAIQLWEALDMPEATNVWKFVALAQAHIALDRLAEAEEMLIVAADLEPENAVVHYFLGILRLSQADRAFEWPDAVGPRHHRLVALKQVASSQRGAPNSKSIYELSATLEFERAIQYAPYLRLDEPLLPHGNRTATELEPAVGDLLSAVGAENFEGKAHHILSCLFRDRGGLELSEHHLDEACKHSINPLDGYQRLADEYRSRGRYSDADRVQRKRGGFPPLRERML